MDKSDAIKFSGTTLTVHEGDRVVFNGAPHQVEGVGIYLRPYFISRGWTMRPVTPPKALDDEKTLEVDIGDQGEEGAGTDDSRAPEEVGLQTWREGVEQRFAFHGARIQALWERVEAEKTRLDHVDHEYDRQIEALKERAETLEKHVATLIEGALKAATTGEVDFEPPDTKDPWQIGMYFTKYLALEVGRTLLFLLGALFWPAVIFLVAIAAERLITGSWL